MTRWWLCAAVGALLAGSALPAHTPAPTPALPRSDLPRSTLAVRASTGEWSEWWRSDAAPTRWRAPLPTVANAVKWQTLRPGLARGTLRLAGTGEAWRIRAIVVSIDPRHFRLRLDAAVGDDGRAGPWTVDDAPRDAALALNAGQFTSDGGPWGWVVHEGREIRPPGSGPLAPAVVVDATGAVRFVPPREIAALRDSPSASPIVEAFQSYPTLLDGDGDVPAPLTDTGRGLDLAHRDSRLAIGETRDGNLLVLLTRFEGLGGTLESLPFGITVPETAALMGALGARQAVMLDGGLSGQLLVRTSPSSPPLAWRGLRRVALGLVAVARQ